MLSRKRIILLASLIIIDVNIVLAAGWRENAKAIDISGGEDHTLVLTANNWPWACGDNTYDQLGLGDQGAPYETTLTRVWGPNAINYLEDINDVDAGWKHSLALDVNGFLWNWGNNGQGWGDGWKKAAFERFFVDFGRGNLV